MLEFTCPTCGKRVQGDDSLAGKYVLCPVCNIAMTAPAATPRSVSAIATPEPFLPTKATQPAGSSDRSFSEGFPPLDSPLPSLRKATPHVVIRLVPYFIAASIVLILAACMLVPTVVLVRDSAARTQSINNLKHIGLAMHNFQDNHRRLPFNGDVPAKPGDVTSGSWAFQILPGLDHDALFRRPDTITATPPYLCPLRGRPTVSTTGAWSDYCINPFLNDPNGTVNAPDSKLMLGRMADGASNTIFAGHGSIDPAMYSSTVVFAQATDIFKGGDPATARRSTTNQPDKRHDTSLTWGSPYSSGAYTVWCDGTVRFMSYSLTGGTIQNGVADGGLGVFLTPAGGERAVIPD